MASDTVLHLELVGGRPRSFRGFVRDLYGIERTNQWCHLTIHEGQSAGEPKCLRRRSCGNLCCTLFKSSVMDISICVRISTRSSFVISLKAVVKCYQARVIFARKSWQKNRRPVVGLAGIARASRLHTKRTRQRFASICTACKKPPTCFHLVLLSIGVLHKVIERVCKI